MPPRRSADSRTVCAAEDTLGEAAFSWDRSVPDSLGSRLLQSRLLNALSNGSKPRFATSSADRATSETALAFCPRPGTEDARVHNGLSAAFFAAAVCARSASADELASVNLFPASSSLSVGTIRTAASSSDLMEDAVDASTAAQTAPVHSATAADTANTATRFRRSARRCRDMLPVLLAFRLLSVSATESAIKCSFP